MNYRKKENPVLLCVLLLSILTVCFTLIGCSMVMEPSANEYSSSGTSPGGASSSGASPNEITSDLRNTTWIKQITDSETITISFGRNTLTMSGDGAAGWNNQQWGYRGGFCCGYGYCRFYNNGQSPLEFRYSRGINGLIITGSNIQSLNGNWTRK